VLPGKEHPDFSVLSLLIEPLDLTLEFAEYVFTFRGKLDQGLKVVEIPRKLRVDLHVLLKAPARLQSGLRLFLPAPEFRLRNPLFELLYLRAFVGRIKDNLESV
jgi:hypothetical protein